MKKLGKRNYALLEIGMKTTGDLEDAYYFIEESLYMNEAGETLDFLLWCKDNDKRFGHGNYEERFAEFKDQQPRPRS